MTRMGPVRVLLVDDDPLLLRTGERLLRRFLGAEVVTSSNGREALDRIERGERFHLVITDLEMPEMDGLELLDRLAVVAPELLVGVWSGCDRAELAAGRAVDFIVRKTHPNGDLIDAVRALPCLGGERANGLRSSGVVCRPGTIADRAEKKRGAS
ncbi:MAG: hypothetical protein SangKO_039480 [Sandaracinaceae bacterium]